jgi:peptidoglycan/xylan/chitin deacetylase (PgdA/CDA1 family)
MGREQRPALDTAYRILDRSGAFRAWRRILSGGGILTVTYHGVLPPAYRPIDPILDGNLIDRRTLLEQLHFLKKRYRIIDPSSFRESLREGSPFPPGAVLITCDDGLVNCLTEMVPLLREEGVPCVFFPTAPSGMAGGPLWHEELFLLLVAGAGNTVRGPEGETIRLPTDPSARREMWRTMMRSFGGRPHAERRSAMAEAAEEVGLPTLWLDETVRGAGGADRFSTLDQGGVRALVAAGMTIGSHTVTHPIMSQLPRGTAVEELTISRVELGRAAKQEVWALAYPFGDRESVGVRERGLAADAGYEVAFRNWGGISTASDDPFFLPRVSVTANMSLPAFHARISGMHDKVTAAGQRIARRLP